MREVDQDDDCWIRPPPRKWYWRGLGASLMTVLSLLCGSMVITFVVIVWQSVLGQKPWDQLLLSVAMIPLFGGFAVYVGFCAYRIWIDPWHGKQVLWLGDQPFTARLITRLYSSEYPNLQSEHRIQLLHYFESVQKARDHGTIQELIALYPALVSLKLYYALFLCEEGRHDVCQDVLEDLVMSPLVLESPGLLGVVRGLLLKCKTAKRDFMGARREVLLMKQARCSPTQSLENLDEAMCLALHQDGKDLRSFAFELIREAESFGPLKVSMRGTLGSLLVLEGRFAEARTMLEEVFERSENETDLRIVSRYLAGAYEGLGLGNEAARWKRASEFLLPPNLFPVSHFSAEEMKGSG